MVVSPRRSASAYGRWRNGWRGRVVRTGSPTGCHARIDSRADSPVQSRPRSSRSNGRAPRPANQRRGPAATVNGDAGAGGAGLNRVALLEPRPVQRYEWPHVGDLLHIDLKRLGRVAGVGQRIHGDRRRRARKVGWEYLHIAVDDATRLTYAEVLTADDAPSCAAFLQRTLAWFRRRGIGVRRLLTDNAMAYRAGVFAAVCRRWTVRQRFTRPYRPQTNGKAERFIQTLLREWAYRRPYRSSARRTADVSPYLRFYNHRRPHASWADARPGCVSKRLLSDEQPL